MCFLCLLANEYISRKVIDMHGLYCNSWEYFLHKVHWIDVDPDCHRLLVWECNWHWSNEVAMRKTALIVSSFPEVAQFSCFGFSKGMFCNSSLVLLGGLVNIAMFYRHTWILSTLVRTYTLANIAVNVNSKSTPLQLNTCGCRGLLSALFKVLKPHLCPRWCIHLRRHFSF